MSFILCSCQKVFVNSAAILQESISVSLSYNNVWECCILYKNIKSKEADLSHSCKVRLKVFSVLTESNWLKNKPPKLAVLTQWESERFIQWTGLLFLIIISASHHYWFKSFTVTGTKISRKRTELKLFHQDFVSSKQLGRKLQSSRNDPQSCFHIIEGNVVFYIKELGSKKIKRGRVLNLVVLRRRWVERTRKETDGGSYFSVLILRFLSISTVKLFRNPPNPPVTHSESLKDSYREKINNTDRLFLTIVLASHH